MWSIIIIKKQALIVDLSFFSVAVVYNFWCAYFCLRVTESAEQFLLSVLAFQ